MPLVFGVVVVMPLVADCVPLGSVKSTVPPAARLMLPRLKSSAFDAAAVRTMAERPRIDRQAVELLAVGRAAVPWIARVPPPKTKEEELGAALLMMLLAGAPAG